MRPKKEKLEETPAYMAGRKAAFLEAAEACRKDACQAFLNLNDFAAKALRDMVVHFLDEAAQCRGIEEKP